MSAMKLFNSNTGTRIVDADSGHPAGWSGANIPRTGDFIQPHYRRDDAWEVIAIEWTSPETVNLYVQPVGETVLGFLNLKQKLGVK